MGMSCLDCHDYMDGYNQGKREGTIEELESLKTKMNIYCDLHGIYDWGLIDLVEERIKQLKGENDGNDI